MAVLVAGVAPEANAFGVDGILGAGDNYTQTLSVGFEVTGKKSPGVIFTDTGTLHIGRNDPTTDGNSDIFVLLSVPFSIVDNNYNQDKNITPPGGWMKSHTFDNLLKSDRFEFKINNDPNKAVGIDYLALNSTTGQYGADFVQPKSGEGSSGGSSSDGSSSSSSSSGSTSVPDGGGMILEKATSLGYDFATFQGNATTNSGGLDLTTRSPLSGDGAIFNNFEFGVNYEFRIAGSAFEDANGGLIPFTAAALAMPVLHASPNKQKGDNVVNVTCQGKDLCVQIVDDMTQAPEPGSLALLGSGLLGFVVLRRRRRRTA